MRSIADTFEVGKNYYFKTVSFHYIGQIVEINALFITIEKGTWIAESGDWGECLNTGTIGNYVNHPPELRTHLLIPNLVVGIEWNHPLPVDKDS